jgi:putative transposase
VAYALRQAEAGTAVTDVCCSPGISEATFYIWKKKYGDLVPDPQRGSKSKVDESARGQPDTSELNTTVGIFVGI